MAKKRKKRGRKVRKLLVLLLRPREKWERKKCKSCASLEYCKQRGYVYKEWRKACKKYDKRKTRARDKAH
ncbi:MAG TPA: hypothetical protein PLS84_03180 [Salinivirgaceae bacterium]|nr:hypothetical protein [Salinivirgaceae bacterium]